MSDPGPPVARTAAQVRRLAGSATLAEVDERITGCRACPRLVAWREEVASTKRAAYADQTYWGRPIPGFGATAPRILVVGLAPAAHGANRTGRVFTGDRSGDWLFASLHRVGLANQLTSVSADDGLELRETRIVAAVRCAPPANRPTPVERDTCAPWLHRELTLVADSLRVVVALGRFGWDATLRAWSALGWAQARTAVAFGHGAEAELPGPAGPVTLLGSYHPSQQNTFTGRLTESMLDDVLGRAAALGTMSSEPPGRHADGAI